MDPDECLEYGTDCKGAVEYRMRPSDGKSFARCEHHAEKYYERLSENARRYPEQQPRDFDPGYAGESWNEW